MRAQPAPTNVTCYRLTCFFLSPSMRLLDCVACRSAPMLDDTALCTLPPTATACVPFHGAEEIAKPLEGYVLCFAAFMIPALVGVSRSCSSEGVHYLLPSQRITADRHPGVPCNKVAFAVFAARPLALAIVFFLWNPRYRADLCEFRALLQRCGARLRRSVQSKEDYTAGQVRFEAPDGSLDTASLVPLVTLVPADGVVEARAEDPDPMTDLGSTVPYQRMD